MQKPRLRRIVGFLTLAAIWIPGCFLLLLVARHLETVPFAAVVVVLLAATVGVLRIAYVARARIDPSFDPAPFSRPKR